MPPRLTVAMTAADLPPVPLYRPGSLAAAVEALASAPAPAAIYAGGTDFFAGLRQGAAPASLIWVASVPEMRGIRREADNLVIGALTTHDAAWRAPELDAIPGLAAAWRRIATVRIRRHATLGGNLMARRPRYEMSILLTALGAVARLAGPEGVTELPVQDIWQADLSAHPLLVSVAIPLAGAPVLDYERSMRPTFTQAACLRGAAGARGLRLVVATEYLRPWFTDADPAAPAADILSVLPATFHDPAVERAYLVQAGAVFLARQLQRMEDPA